MQSAATPMIRPVDRRDPAGGVVGSGAGGDGGCQSGGPAGGSNRETAVGPASGPAGGPAVGPAVGAVGGAASGVGSTGCANEYPHWVHNGRQSSLSVWQLSQLFDTRPQSVNDRWF